MSNNSRIAAAVGSLAILLAACSGGSGSNGVSPGGSAQNATVSAALVDGPFRSSGGTVTAVDVAIARVELIGNGAPVTIATYSPSKKIDLLDYLSQSAPLSLGSAPVPAGSYSQLRLVLDTSSPSNTTVTVNGTTYDLTIPSASNSHFSGSSSVDDTTGPGTSGIKVNIALNAQAGVLYGYVLDFNAAESIVSAGNSGQWLMKPVVVASTAITSGTIAGVVTNGSNGQPIGNAEVLAEQNGQIVNSGVTDPTTGAYQINALPAGSYTLVVNNTWTNQAGQAQTATNAPAGLASFTLATDVVVTAGASTTANIVESIATPTPSPTPTP